MSCGSGSFKKLFAAVLAVVLFTAGSAVTFSSASSLSEVREQLDDAKQQLSEGEAQAKELIAQIDDLESQIQSMESEIQRTQSEIDMKQMEIDAAQQELTDKQNAMAAQDSSLGQRLRVMYKNGETSMMEILLGSSSMDELITNMDMIQRIYDNDLQLLQYIKDEYASIAEQKQNLLDLQGQLQEQQDAQRIKQDELKKQEAEAEELKAKVLSNNEALEIMIADLNKEAQRMTSYILSSGASTSENSVYYGGIMAWPVPSSSRITSYYGGRIDPINGSQSGHSGMDIAAPQGTPIIAANDGVVILSQWNGSYGNCVMIDHGGGIVTLYGHISQLIASVGQVVTRGETIALVGSTGRSTGPHCHFEVRINGSTTDPLNYL